MPAMKDRESTTSILVKLPTRQRPELFRRQFNAWLQRRSGWH